MVNLVSIKKSRRETLFQYFGVRDLDCQLDYGDDFYTSNVDVHRCAYNTIENLLEDALIEILYR